MKESDAIQKANDIRRGLTFRYAKSPDADEDNAVIRGIEYGVAQRNAALQANDEIEARRWQSALSLVSRGKTAPLKKEIKIDGRDFKSLPIRNEELSGLALENLSDSIPQD